MKIAVRLVLASAALLILLFFLLFSFSPPDATNGKWVSINEINHNDSIIKGGWSQMNLWVSDYNILAGYRKRPGFTQVLDTPKITAVVFHTAPKKTAWINADLLLFPPDVKTTLEELLGDQFTFYYTASHTHHSFGGWEPSLAGRIIAGRYNTDVPTEITSRIIGCLQDASEKNEPLYLHTARLPFEKWNKNRLSDAPSQPDLLQLMLASPSDTLESYSYAPHPTTIHAQRPYLTNDYPGWWQRHILQKKRTPLMFAGPVGGLSVQEYGLPEHTLQDSMLHHLITESEKVDVVWKPLHDIRHIRHRYGKVKPALRIDDDIYMRPWLFGILFNSLELEVNQMSLNGLTLFGVPADYNGELTLNLPDDVWVTSFSGNYLGYISPEKYYHNSSHEEIRSLNWVLPHVSQEIDSLMNNRSITKPNNGLPG